MPTVHDELVAALALIGGRYVLGAKSPGPHGESDCSGYISGICARIGVPMAAGSYAQQDFCAARGTYKPGAAGVAWASKIPGALLFRRAGTGGDAIGHVVVVADGNRTLEYRGKAYGSGSWPIDSRVFTGGALIPGVNYATPAPAPPPPPVPVPVDYRRLAAAQLVGPLGQVPAPLTVNSPPSLAVLAVQKGLNLDRLAGIPESAIYDANTAMHVASFQDDCRAMGMTLEPPTTFFPGTFTNLTKFWLCLGVQNIANGN